jgi:hypothetical protein
MLPLWWQIFNEKKLSCNNQCASSESIFYPCYFLFDNTFNNFYPISICQRKVKLIQNLKGLSHQSESGMVGKSTNRKRAIEHKKFFSAPSTFNKCEQKRSPSEKRDGSCHVFANSRWKILPPFLLAGCRYLGISQRLSYTF